MRLRGRQIAITEPLRAEIASPYAMCSLGSCQREALLPSLGAGPAATVFSLARPGWLSGFRSLGPRNGPQRLFDCSNLALEQSPLTESNRRPSPYHLGHKDP